jgi:hypothetical protein
MTFRAAPWLLASALFLNACSEGKPVVIQPGIFTEDWPTALRKELVESKRCAIDQINGKNPHQNTLSFKSGEPLNMSGWIFSQTDGVSPEVYVQLVGPALTYTALTQKRTPRPDLIQLFKLQSNWDAGFELQADQNAEPGEYRLEILQPGSKGIADCKIKVIVKIDPK